MREDWLEVELGEVCFGSKGKKPPVLESQCTEKVGVPYINIKAFEKGIIDEYTDGEKCNLCKDGDLLMVWDGARAGLSGKARKGAVGSTLMKIEEVKGIEKQYLSYFLLSLYTKINTNPRGVGIPHVEPRILWQSKLLIVSSPIQRAIVSKIEALFSDLDNGIANFKKAQEQLKIYRQAVLKKAFEGKLSEPLINDDLSDDSDLEKEKTNQSFNQKNHSSDNLPKGWKWVKSGELFSFVTSGSRGWAKYYSESGSIFIRITNLNFDTLNLDLREEKIQYVNPPQNSEGLRTRVQEGDFLFSITGYLGMFAIAPKLENAFVNQHVSLCRPKDFFDKKYLAYWIISKSGGHYYLNKNQKGAVKAGLNLDDLKNFPVPLPSTFAEQTQIVQEIERRLSVCDKMEQSISESLEKAEALRQSILKKAFEGKLLSEAEIEQCKQAADYEPASELLKKIRNEKLRITKKKPRNS